MIVQVILKRCLPRTWKFIKKIVIEVLCLLAYFHSLRKINYVAMKNGPTNGQEEEEISAAGPAEWDLQIVL